MRNPAIFAALLALAACGDANDEPATTQDPRKAADEAGRAAAAVAGADASTAARAPTAERVALSDADQGRVCRAAIASLNGRDPAIIRVISAAEGIQRVRYTRDDGTVWTNECRVGAGTAEWRAVLDGKPGRWRDEDTIRFTVDGKTINIQTFMMGEPVTNDTYEVD